MPSNQVLQALRGSFVRLAEALCLEFTSQLGAVFYLVSVQEVGLRQEPRQFSTIVQVRLRSGEEVASAFCSQWVVSAGSWVHSMAEAFPELRGTTTVGIERDRQPAVAVSPELPRAA